MDQKMMKTLGAVIAGFIVFILLLFILSSCNGKNYTFDKLESEMMKVAKSYYESKKEELPAMDKDTKTLTLKKMISDGKIKELSDLFKEEVKCDGSITVTNNNGYYSYSPYLSCGKDYKSTYLRDKIIEDSLVEEGPGLYEEKNAYIMKGEVNNNYISFNGGLYRIMRINEDGTIRLFQQDGTKQKNWDNRYNPQINFNSGLNEYENNGLDSRIKEFLQDYYNDSSIWPDHEKAYISTQDLCIGKRAQKDTSKDGSIECSKKLQNQQFGVIAAYEYLQASLDKNCLETTSKACKNYNWLGILESNFWTITAVRDSSYFVYNIYNVIEETNASSFSSINVVFNIIDKAIYVKGTGTKEDPYVFK